MIKVELFTGLGCGICTVIKPKLEELHAEMSFFDLDIIQVEDNKTYAAERNVFVVPVCVISAEGKEYYRFKGSFSIQEVREKISRLYDLQQ